LIFYWIAAAGMEGLMMSTFGPKSGFSATVAERATHPASAGTRQSGAVARRASQMRR